MSSINYNINEISSEQGGSTKPLNSETETETPSHTFFLNTLNTLRKRAKSHPQNQSLQDNFVQNHTVSSNKTHTATQNLHIFNNSQVDLGHETMDSKNSNPNKVGTHSNSTMNGTHDSGSKSAMLESSIPSPAANSNSTQSGNQTSPVEVKNNPNRLPIRPNTSQANNHTTSTSTHSNESSSSTSTTTTISTTSTISTVTTTPSANNTMNQIQNIDGHTPTLSIGGYSKNTNLGYIIGGSIGGLFVLFGLIGFCFSTRKRRKLENEFRKSLEQEDKDRKDSLDSLDLKGYPSYGGAQTVTQHYREKLYVLSPVKEEEQHGFNHLPSSNSTPVPSNEMGTLEYQPNHHPEIHLHDHVEIFQQHEHAYMTQTNHLDTLTPPFSAPQEYEPAAISPFHPQNADIPLTSPGLHYETNVPKVASQDYMNARSNSISSVYTTAELYEDGRRTEREDSMESKASDILQRYWNQQKNSSRGVSRLSFADTVFDD
jgi:hypothetical protein